MRLLIITDFTESFPYSLLKGIIRYAREHEQWEICRMPPAYKKSLGIHGVVSWALNWGADVVIGQFEQNDEVGLFEKNGIVAIAQDYKQRFKEIPNITADYIGTGAMAARFYLEKGFRNFAFFGFSNVCWSDERRDGFRMEVEKAGFGDHFFEYNMQEIENLWYYERASVGEWLKSLPLPIAVMASDDNQANNLIEACNAFGIKVPAELSIIGVDNDEVICNLSNPTLSSIAVDIEDGGYMTAELAERLVNDPSAKVRDVVLRPVKIVNRISTAAFATSDEEIQKAVRFIHMNLQNKISVTDVVNNIALSRRLLETRFRNVTGKSVYQYITAERVQYFAEQLLTTNEQVFNIAVSMGENDSKVISRSFKAHYGCTPGEYRERNKK